jgi:light-regulated signal transduction histidine kinase (bacteriophytochrome)
MRPLRPIFVSLSLMTTPPLWTFSYTYSLTPGGSRRDCTRAAARIGRRPARRRGTAREDAELRTICRRIVHEHHGTFEISSVVGQGTTIGLTLPCTNATNKTYLRERTL